MSDAIECQGCAKTGDDVQRRRQNTAYVYDESNYATLCTDCKKDADEYWAKRWAEYYAEYLDKRVSWRTRWTYPA